MQNTRLKKSVVFYCTSIYLRITSNFDFVGIATTKRVRG